MLVIGHRLGADVRTALVLVGGCYTRPAPMPYQRPRLSQREAICSTSIGSVAQRMAPPRGSAPMEFGFGYMMGGEPYYRA